MKGWVCLLLIGVFTFTNAKTISIWLDGKTIQAEILADGIVCDTATNTIILQDETRNGKPCPKSDDIISSKSDAINIATPTEHFSNTVSSEELNQEVQHLIEVLSSNHTISNEELDQAIQNLTENSQNSKLPTYQTPIYQGWVYNYWEDEFSNDGGKVATVVSTDTNAILSVAIDNKKNLYVSFYLMREVDANFVSHFPLCYGKCTIDLRVDDKKYPNIAIIRQGNVLYSQYPQTTLKRIKNGSVIKIRVPLLSGSLHTYTFVIDEPLNMRKLKL